MVEIYTDVSEETFDFIIRVEFFTLKIETAGSSKTVPIFHFHDRILFYHKDEANLFLGNAATRLPDHTFSKRRR
jgi:hypothetical protein